MPARSLRRINEDGIYLHIYNKGVENRAIFNDEQDYKAFLGFLEEYLSAPKDPEAIKTTFKVNDRTFRGIPHQPKNYLNKVDLVAYHLAPTHFHLIVKQTEAGSVEKFIRSLSTRYSIYFNKKYARSGALFAGPYRSIKLEPDSLTALIHHLHQDSEYSSNSEYQNQRKTAWIKSEEHQELLSGYQPDPNFNLENFLLENALDHKKIVKKPVEKPLIEEIKLPVVNKEKRNYSTLFQFAVISSFFFILLTIIGAGNIALASVNRSLFYLPSPTSVLSVAAPSKLPEPTALPTPTPTPLLDLNINEASAEATPSAQINLQGVASEETEEEGEANEN